MNLQNQTLEKDTNPVLEEKEFFPRGAIAFFILFMALMVLIWASIYFIMIYRSQL